MKDVCELAKILSDGKSLQTKIAENVFNYYDLDNSGNFCKTELKVRQFSKILTMFCGKRI